jgi:ribosome-binding protein aMBF1 (putative translation factor)
VGGYVFVSRAVFSIPHQICEGITNREEWTRKKNQLTRSKTTQRMEDRLVAKDLKEQESTDLVTPALRIQFGRNLQIARKKAGLMQKDLAKRVGQPGNYISMVENGRARLTMQQARRLAELVKADVGGLFGLHLETPQAKETEGERFNQGAKGDGPLSTP